MHPDTPLPTAARERPCHCAGGTPAPAPSTGFSTAPVDAGRAPVPCPSPAPAPAPVPAVASGCHIDIHAAGDVHVHQHCGSPPEAPVPRPCPEAGPGFPPPAEGNTCLPPVAGRKPKQAPGPRLARLAARAGVPSVLAASTLALVRRFGSGAAPANALEQAVFGRLAAASPLVRQTLACAAERLAALPAGQRGALFDSGFDGNTPVDPATLSTRLGREFVARAGLRTFGDPLAPEQPRPGRIRVFPPGVEDFFVQVRICSINTLRTDDFIPPPSLGSYRPEEVAHDCTTTLVDGRPQVSCSVRTGNCNGPAVPGVCLRIPTVEAGTGVVLQGVNYFSTDAVVRITAKPQGPVGPNGAVRVLPAHVFGDLDTPVTEPAPEGGTRLVNDCRVQDRLTFTVPADLGPGFYEIQVEVPNITGIPGFGTVLGSNFEAIEVLPASTARYAITAETLDCREETSPASFGSDEVGLRVLAVPLLADLSTGVLQTTTRRFGDVDSGEARDVSRVLFQQDRPMLAVAMTVLGHEVDGEDAYNNLVTSVSDIFVDLVKAQFEFAKGALAAAGITAASLGKLGPVGFVIIGIAVAITLAIDLIIALWAPADLIIEDPTGFSALELAERTGADFPAPTTAPFTTEGGIRVSATPIDKVPLEYRERRDYVSNEEDSRYALVYRFNRTA